MHVVAFYVLRVCQLSMETKVISGSSLCSEVLSHTSMDTKVCNLHFCHISKRRQLHVAVFCVQSSCHISMGREVYDGAVFFLLHHFKTALMFLRCFSDDVEQAGWPSMPVKSWCISDALKALLLIRDTRRLARKGWIQS